MSEFAQYWLRILGAVLLIKVASTLVKDAEKLITANVKHDHPEIADEIDGVVEVEAVEEFEEINGKVSVTTDETAN